MLFQVKHYELAISQIYYELYRLFHVKHYGEKLSNPIFVLPYYCYINESCCPNRVLINMYLCANECKCCIRATAFI